MRGTREDAAGRPGWVSPAALLCTAAVLSGCASAPAPVVVQGRAVSMLFDPNRVAGLPVTDGPSGPRSAPPSAAGRVANTDDSSVDRLALLTAEDVEDYWQQHDQELLSGSFSPVSGLVSVDPEASRPRVCGSDPATFSYNAAYCLRSDVIAWDRVGLLPVAEKFFGEMAVSGLLAHEYGHALQHKTGLVDGDTPLLVSEQQADCFAGVYLRWVAEGESPRFNLNTTDGLDKVLAGALAIRDRPPDFNPFGRLPVEASHGTALDRVSAVQQGFDRGTASCTRITMAEIRQRRGDIPASLFDPAAPQSDMELTEQALSSLIVELDTLFSPSQPPTLEMGVSCGPGPAAYCPDNNTIEVDLSGLEQIGTPASESQRVLLQGDNSAISVVTSRYMLALQKERGAVLQGQGAAMRTACLTGVAQSKMANPILAGDGLVLGAGDLDEAVSGLLTNGIAGSDAAGISVPSGFTRILAFRSGLAGDPERCYRLFP
jgi:predicted metalloprotease